MERINTSTKAVDLFGAGKHGFQGGDPGTGVFATHMSPELLNALQEEIANVIEGIGTPLNPASHTQLLTAITAIASAATGWTTGDAKLTLKTAADAGWVLANDGTIGNAASGATTRANADCAALFALLWNNVSNTHAAVSGGRGGSAAADFAANKTIALTKMLGRSIAISGTGATLTARAHGSTVGAETHTLTTPEMPAHVHPAKTVGPGGTLSQSSLTAGATDLDTGSTGGGGSHNNMQPSTFLNIMIKL